MPNFTSVHIRVIELRCNKLVSEFVILIKMVLMEEYNNNNNNNNNNRVLKEKIEKQSNAWAVY